MPKQRGRSAKRSATAGWDKALNEAPIADDEWTPFLILAVSNGEVSDEFLRKGADDVSTGRREYFRSLTHDDMAAWAKDNAKAKSKAKDPVEVAIQEALTQAVDAEGTIPTPLLARLIKAKVLLCRNEVMQQRAEAEAAKKAEAEAAANGGAVPAKKPDKKAKGKKGAPATDGPGKKKSGMVKRSDEKATTVDDEPEIGPDMYFYLQGMNDPALIKELGICGAPAALVLDCSAAADAEVAKEKAEKAEKDGEAVPPAPAPQGTYKERVLPDVAASADTSQLRGIAWMTAELGVKGAIEPEEIFDKVATEAYAVVQQRKDFDAYQENLTIFKIPTCPPVDKVDTEHYASLLLTIPCSSQSVAVVLDCMLEQVEFNIAADGAVDDGAPAASEAAGAGLFGFLAPGDAQPEQLPVVESAEGTAAEPSGEGAGEGVGEGVGAGAAATTEAGESAGPGADAQPMSDEEDKENAQQEDAQPELAVAVVPQDKTQDQPGGPTIVRYGDAAAARSAHLKMATGALTPMDRERRVFAASMGAVLSSFANVDMPSIEERAMSVQQMRHFTDLEDPVVDRGLWQFQFEALLKKAIGVECDLAEWCISEGLHKESLAQVLMDTLLSEDPAVHVGVDTTRAAKLVLLLKEHTSLFLNSSRWAANTATVPGFTNYLEHIAPSLPASTPPGSIGYVIGDQLINLAKADHSVLPPCGGQVVTSTVEYLKGPTYSNRKIVKDGDTVTLHVLQDGSPDSFVAAMADGTIVAVSSKALKTLVRPSADVVAAAEVEAEADASPADAASAANEKDTPANTDDAPETAAAPAVEEVAPAPSPLDSNLEFSMGTVDGLTISVLSGGCVSMAYGTDARKATERFQHIATAESSRCYYSNGTVVRWLVDGKVQLYMADGTICEKDGSGWTALEMTGKRVRVTPRVEPAATAEIMTGTAGCEGADAGADADAGAADAQAEPAGADVDALPSLHVDEMTDAPTKSTVRVRQDLTTCVQHGNGSTVLQFPDGTRIYTEPSGAADGAPAYVFECLGFARIELTAASTHVELLSGTSVDCTHVEPNSRHVTFTQASGSCLHLDEPTRCGSLVCPATSNLGASDFVHSTSFSLVDLSYETRDQKETAYTGRPEGGQATVKSGEASESLPMPRLFVIKQDGSGLELHHSKALNDYSAAATGTSSIHVVEQPVAGDDSSKSVTYLEHAGAVNDYLAAYREMNVLPEALQRRPAPYAITQNKRKGPAVTCRQVIQHDQLDKDSRKKLIDNLAAFRAWKVARDDEAKALQADSVAATAVLALNSEGVVGDELEVVNDNNSAILARYEDATRPPPKQEAPDLRPGIVTFDDYFAGGPWEGSMQDLEVQFAEGFIPKYWDSEEYIDARAHAQIRAEDGITQDLRESQFITGAYPAATVDFQDPPKPEPEVLPSINPSLLNPQKPLPPIQPTALSVTVSPNPATASAQTPHVALELVNHDVAPVRFRLGDVAGIALGDYVPGPIAPGMSAALTLRFTPADLDVAKVVDGTFTDTIAFTTTAGMVYLPVQVSGL